MTLLTRVLLTVVVAAIAIPLLLVTPAPLPGSEAVDEGVGALSLAQLVIVKTLRTLSIYFVSGAALVVLWSPYILTALANIFSPGRVQKPRYGGPERRNFRR